MKTDRIDDTAKTQTENESYGKWEQGVSLALTQWGNEHKQKTPLRTKTTSEVGTISEDNRQWACIIIMVSTQFISIFTTAGGHFGFPALWIPLFALRWTALGTPWKHLASRAMAPRCCSCNGSAWSLQQLLLCSPGLALRWLLHRRGTMSEPKIAWSYE